MSVRLPKLPSSSRWGRWWGDCRLTEPSPPGITGGSYQQLKKTGGFCDLCSTVQSYWQVMIVEWNYRDLEFELEEEGGWTTIRSHIRVVPKALPTFPTFPSGCVITSWADSNSVPSLVSESVFWNKTVSVSHQQTHTVGRSCPSPQQDMDYRHRLVTRLTQLYLCILLESCWGRVPGFGFPQSGWMASTSPLSSQRALRRTTRSLTLQASSGCSSSLFTTKKQKVSTAVDSLHESTNTQSYFCGSSNIYIFLLAIIICILSFFQWTYGEKCLFIH